MSTPKASPDPAHTAEDRQTPSRGAAFRRAAGITSRGFGALFHGGAAQQGLFWLVNPSQWHTVSPVLNAPSTAASREEGKNVPESLELPGRNPALNAAFHVSRGSSDLTKSCCFQTLLALISLGTRCLPMPMKDEFLASSAGRMKMGVGTAPSG